MIEQMELKSMAIDARSNGEIAFHARASSENGTRGKLLSGAVDDVYGLHRLISMVEPEIIIARSDRTGFIESMRPFYPVGSVWALSFADIEGERAEILWKEQAIRVTRESLADIHPAEAMAIIGELFLLWGGAINMLDIASAQRWEGGYYTSDMLDKNHTKR